MHIYIESLSKLKENLSIKSMKFNQDVFERKDTKRKSYEILIYRLIICYFQINYLQHFHFYSRFINLFSNFLMIDCRTL